jgi:dTDP-4-dehydrorhamnose reductase
MTGRRVAITGATGQLGRELVRAFTGADDQVLALSRPDFDITKPVDLDRLAAWQPDIVINSAAWTDVDGCALDPERAMLINGEAAGAVASAAARAGALIVQISTNEVFDGTLDRPYTEDDEPNPINPYGVSKLRGEKLVTKSRARHIIVRTSWIYSGRSGFPSKIEAAASDASSSRPLRVVADESANPTRADWLADAIVRLVTLPVPHDSTYHLAGWPPASRFEWARAILDLHVVIEPITRAQYLRASRVPPRAVLDVTRAAELGIPPGRWQRSPGAAEGVGPDIGQGLFEGNARHPAGDPTQ